MEQDSVSFSFWWGSGWWMNGPIYFYRRRRKRCWAYFKCREMNGQRDKRILREQQQVWHWDLFQLKAWKLLFGIIYCSKTSYLNTPNASPFLAVFLYISNLLSHFISSAVLYSTLLFALLENQTSGFHSLKHLLIINRFNNSAMK